MYSNLAVLLDDIYILAFIFLDKKEKYGNLMQAQEMLHAACKRAALMSWISVSQRFWPALLTLSKITFIFHPYYCELETGQFLLQ